MTRVTTGGTGLEEGAYFGVPLQGGLFGVGLIARWSRKSGPIALGYFFGPPSEEIPTIEAAAKRRPEDAALVCRFGVLGLRNGQWPLVGLSPGWIRSDWSFPLMSRIVPGLASCAYECVYDDDRPDVMLSETRVSLEAAEKLPTADLFGAGAVQSVLAARLSRQ